MTTSIDIATYLINEYLGGDSKSKIIPTKILQNGYKYQINGEGG